MEDNNQEDQIQNIEPSTSIAINFADKIRSIEKFEVNNATFLDFIRAVKSTIETLDMAVLDKDDLALQSIERARKIESSVIEKKMTDAVQYTCALAYKQSANYYRTKIVYLESIIKVLDSFLIRAEEIVINNMGINGENIKLKEQIRFTLEKLEEKERTWKQRFEDNERFWKEKVDDLKTKTEHKRTETPVTVIDPPASIKIEDPPKTEQPKIVQEIENTKEIYDFIKKQENLGKTKQSIVIEIIKKWPELTESKIINFTGYTHDTIYRGRTKLEREKI